MSAGTAAAALAVTPLGGNGVVSIANAVGTTELSVNVVGYYPLTGGQVYRPTGTLRLYDSRRDPAGTLQPGVARTVTMPALSGIPATAMTGAMLNVSTVSPAGTGTLTVQSSGGDRENPTVAFTAGSLVKSRAVVRLQGGTFTLTSHTAATHVVVDAVGWWAPAEVVHGRLFQPRRTARVLDTRSGVGAPRGKVGAGKVLGRQGRREGPAGAGRCRRRGDERHRPRRHPVDLDHRVAVRQGPPGVPRPVGARLPGDRQPRRRQGREGKGRIKLTNGSGATHLVGDVVGYYR